MGKINIYKLLNIFRKCCDQYYEDIYKNEKLLYDNEFKNVAVDESLFLHDNFGKKEWLIGLIDIQARRIRLKVVNERTEQIINKIIKHHIGINNAIIIDGPSAFN